MKKIKDKVLDQDIFGYNPENELVFNRSTSFNTFPGAVFSIFLSALFLLLWYQQFFSMFTFGGNNTNES